ncbi:hypothetical protein ACW9H6_27990 [Pseudomonas sp. SDO528_S397]
MFNYNKPLDLPTQLQWKYLHEAALLSWTIRARNYNTFIANTMFWTCFTLISGGSILIYRSMDDDPLFSGLLTLAFFIITNIVLISITHHKINFAYRLTTSGIECCEWKKPSKFSPAILKWLTVATAIIFIFIAVVDPASLFEALIGPGGMGLTYLLIANSKNHQNMHTHYHHLAYEWKDFTQLAIATNREVVDLKYTMYDEGMVSWNQNIFCKTKQKENVGRIIKSYLPTDVPFVRAKVNVPMSTS